MNIRFLLFVLCFVLSSCGGGGGGGGSGSVPSVGQFVDAPVAGLSYTCGAYSGTTNATGQFNYSPGSKCTFSVGNVTVGSLSSIPSDGVVTPQDAAGVSRTAASDPGATAIAQFLQSIGTSSGGVISISNATTQSLASVPATVLVSSTGAVTQDTLSNIVAAVPGASLVSPSTASSVLATQIQAAGINTSVGVAPAGSPPKLDAITILAPSNSNASGLGIQLSAGGNYTDGTTTDLTSSVTWSSSNTSVLTINSNGVATGVSPGTANVTATSSNGITSSIGMTVTPATLVSISVTSNASTIPSGLTQQMVATGTYTDNTISTLSSGVTWSVSNSNATISSGGIVTGAAVGTSTVSATVGTISGNANLTISSAVLQSIAISAPISVTSAPIGLAEQLVALGTYSDKTTANLANLVSWKSNSNASVNSSGVLSGISIGTASITASYQGVTSSAFSLQIASPGLVSIAITAKTTTNAPTASSAPAGYTQQLIATGTYTDNSTQDITTSATWTSAAQGVATVTSGTSGGGVTGVTQGTTVITAKYSEVSSQVTFTVGAPALVSIAVSASSTTDIIGFEDQLTATGTYSNNSTQNITSQVIWTASNSNVSITNTSLIGTKTGTTGITASLGGISSTPAVITIAPNIVSGVAATGAPMANASIVLIDALGNSATTTSDSSGNYSINANGLIPPYVLSASGAVSDTQTIMVSVMPASSSYNSNTIVNINPLTHAVASSISPSNDPLSLLDANKINATNITSQKVSSAVAFLNQSFGTLLTNSGSTPIFNPISDTFSANGSGLDRLLDNITNTTQPGSGSIIFVKDAATVDDMAGTSQPANNSLSSLAASSVSLNSTTNLSSSNNLPQSLSIRDYTVAVKLVALLH